MSYTAPRHSYLGAMRVRGFNTRYHGGLLVDTSHGPAMVPAYSIDDDVLAVGFLEAAPGGQGSILCRRTPEDQDGKEATSLKVVGGAAWCPSTNKFYHGANQLNTPTLDGQAIKFNPLSNGFDIQTITGFPATGQGGRCIYIPDQDEMWMNAAVGSGHMFAVINVSDDSFTYVDGAGATDFTYCASTNCLYVSSIFKIYKVDCSTRAVTDLLTRADVEAALGSPTIDFQFGPIEYVSSLGRVLFSQYYDLIPFPSSHLLQIDPSTDTITDYHNLGPILTASYLYYTAEFDRLIIMHGNLGYLASWDAGGGGLTDNVQLWNGTTADFMTAAKGCYVDSASKVALPVQTGDLGARNYTVNFYGADELLPP